MKRVLEKHKKKILGILIALTAINLLDIVQYSSLYLSPHEEYNSIFVGEDITFDVMLESNIPVNVSGVNISFPKEYFEVLKIDKEGSLFDLWAEETSIKEDLGIISFGGGTTRPGGFAGKGKILSITLRAKSAGAANLKIVDSSILAHDGEGTNVLNNIRGLSYFIHEQKSLGGQSLTQSSNKKSPSLDINGDGKIGLADASRILIKIFSTYEPKYDLNMDGKINLKDVGIITSKINHFPTPQSGE